MDDAPQPRTPRRSRRSLAAVMAVMGVAAIGLAMNVGEPERPTLGGSKSAGSLEGSSDASVDGVDADQGDPAEPSGDGATFTPGAPTNKPGGVGKAPEKTGLPARPPEGGLVRSGSAEDGCFPDMRSYLDAWHETGQEPVPCFTPQEPSGQRQPEDVKRSYNGERF
ncbi:MAG: hypothetical protein ACRDY7_08480 [Acidimicrobiia bacterium]